MIFSTYTHLHTVSCVETCYNHDLQYTAIAMVHFLANWVQCNGIQCCASHYAACIAITLPEIKATLHSASAILGVSLTTEVSLTQHTEVQFGNKLNYHIMSL